MPTRSPSCRSGRAISSREATDLKKVADAWEPLYKTLNDEQKQRMRLFAADFLKLVINAAQVRRKQIEEEVEE